MSVSEPAAPATDEAEKHRLTALAFSGIQLICRLRFRPNRAVRPGRRGRALP